MCWLAIVDGLFWGTPVACAGGPPPCNLQPADRLPAGLLWRLPTLSMPCAPLTKLPLPCPVPVQTGIRLSPFGGFLSAQDSDPVGSISYLLEQLNK